MEPIQRVPTGASRTGRYLITTSSGTEYELNLDLRCATRRGKGRHAWGPGHDVGYGQMTGDGDPFFFSTLRTLNDDEWVEVGESMFMDNSGEWRCSTPVKTIERIA